MQTLDAAALEVANNYESGVVPYVTGPCAAILLEHAKPQPGERVVDVATGTGIVARLVAPMVGESGRVVGVDVNPAMLEVGRTREAPAGATIEWMEGNAQHLPLPDAEFDLALCQHGLQFMPDGTKALREMRRVLRSGGRVVLAVWDSLEHNPFPRSFWTVMARHLQVQPEILAVQFSCGDAAEVRQMLDEAGFREISLSPSTLVIRQPRPPDFIGALIASARKLLPALDAMSDAERATLAREVTDECADVLAQHTDDGHLVYPLSLHIATGRA